ncbi:MAG TPA: CaiB/BaiF CoA-transferase family protein [Nitriliruptorales bacterium]|nr:CaiB/BaiF CoA-transferase family protein [Nitriliruptorales bacterium]
MGPLAGVRLVELAAIGPAPFGVMLLADLGADVVRVDRLPPAGSDGAHVSMLGLSRGRRSIAVDLKHPGGLDLLLRLSDGADVLVEGYRPGVAERLGFGPDACLARNPRLVYARVTGWGQDGPLADRAGHDIDVAAVAGALHPIGRAGEPPPPPLNLVADFGGGGTYVAVGVLAALLERKRSGRGQVVDVAMVDGVASLTAMLHGLLAANGWSTQRGDNLLDGSAPFYDTYRTADGGFLAVGCLEPRFYAQFLDRLGLDPADWPQFDRDRWPEQKRRLADIFARRTRDEWLACFEGSDACVAPVLSLTEAPQHPHIRARGTFITVGGVRQPAPAPRLSRTPGAVTRPAPAPGEHTDEILDGLGYSRREVAALRRAGTVA